MGNGCFLWRGKSLVPARVVLRKSDFGGVHGGGGGKNANSMLNQHKPGWYML